MRKHAPRFEHWWRVKHPLSILAGLTALAGCTAPQHASAAPSGDCPIIKSANWRAWVNAMPGPRGHTPQLIVVGNVTMPSGEWTPRFTGIRVMESDPVQVVVELDATSSGSGIQVPVEREVRGSWPSAKAVGSVTVTCRGTTLVRLSPIETAH